MKHAYHRLRLTMIKKYYIINIEIKTYKIFIYQEGKRMVVTCKMIQCPFYSTEGFCSNNLVNIDELGMCSVIWRQGQQRQFLKLFSKDSNNVVNIVDVEIKEEGAEVPSEDPLSGDAANKNE